MKEAILEIIDDATMEQIDQLVGVFESGYLAAQNKELDDWLKVQMERIKWEMESKKKALEQETLNKLDGLEEKLTVTE